MLREIYQQSLPCSLLKTGVSSVAGVAQVEKPMQSLGLPREMVATPRCKNLVTGVSETPATRKPQHGVSKPILAQHKQNKGSPIVETRKTPETPIYRLLTEDERYVFEERAAIMEFDGGLSREEAERLTWLNF